MSRFEQTIPGLPRLGQTLAGLALMEVVQNDVNYSITYAQLKSNLLMHPNPNTVCGIVNGELVPISNMTEAPNDGRAYIRKEKAWVASAMESPSDPFHQLVRRADQWERIDRVDVRVFDPAGLAGFDLAISQVFKLNGELDYNIIFKNLPESERSMEISLIFLGSGGVVTWPPNIIWHQSTVPQLGNIRTIVKLTWTGDEFLGRIEFRA